ncbi:MAG: decarboxylating NADP(+)-dependent phosphogluconate dehydrogenase, partial [Reichenbachiella sp.]
FVSGKVNWVLLNSSVEVLTARVNNRKGHFLDPNILKSQIDTLETPNYGVNIDVKSNLNQIKKEALRYINMNKSEIGLIGLGVMGKSLALNIANNGFELSVYNRSVKGVEENVASNFESQHSEGRQNLHGFDDLGEFIDSLESPKRIMLMVNAGAAVDSVIDSLAPYLNKGDVVIDGGNSHYDDTKRRVRSLVSQGIQFVGCGISGGEEGALKGPSMMPGGSPEGYRLVEKVLTAISAKDDKDGDCCAFVGLEGSGHFVKMVHNGIEYGEMQLIAETYHLLRFHIGLSVDEIAALFKSWNESDLQSYLLEISSQILTVKEGDDYLIDLILDVAQQKGTGGWSTTAALNLGMPLSTISEAVMARCLSAQKNNRIAAKNVYGAVDLKLEGNKEELVEKVCQAYRVARMVNHAIGFDVIREMSSVHNWEINLSELARLWTNGCIIRSGLMKSIITSTKMAPSQHLLLNSSLIEIIKGERLSLASTVSQGILKGCYMPVFSAALNYLNGFTSDQLSTNMIQAQRDFFGAHTYRRVDRSEDEVFHTEWSKLI